MKKLLFITGLVLLSSCQKTKPNSNTNTQELYDKSATTLFHARPASATLYGIDEKLAGGHYSDRLDDYSPTAEAQLRHDLNAIALQLHHIKNKDDNTEVMENLTRYFAGSQDFDIGYIDTWMGLSAFIVNQINGPLIDVPNVMITNQQIKSLEAANDYIKRLDHFDIFVEHVLAKMAADANANWIPPLVIVNKSSAAMKSFIQPKSEEHPFVTTFIEKIKDLDNITAQQKGELAEKVKNLVKNKVYPAYNSVLTQLEDLSLSARAESGIWAQPNGVAFYADAVKKLGDTDLTPAQIHQLGLDEVTRITKEMDEILRSQGMTEGTVGARMTALNDDPQFLYEDSDTGRQQLLNDLNGHIKEIEVLMPTQFKSIPKYEVEVRKFPKSREQTSPGGMYTNPPLDGSAPGIYWINLYNIKANPKFDLKTLTYHEAIPGHHWQVALNLEQDDLPMLRRIAPYNAYVEGWALYSELVAKEMGLYKGDPFSDLGRLKAELFRAVRLVVDTGLHYKKWSREQAIKYMAETTGTVESDVIAEIERYMVWPGQALGYKMGMLNILKLRAQAKQQLGNKFDIKAFHDVVLLGGAVPMEVLNQKVAEWIKSQQ
jgi:uncharacterized protein (DUF885 family)